MLGSLESGDLERLARRTGAPVVEVPRHQRDDATLSAPPARHRLFGCVQRAGVAAVEVPAGGKHVSSVSPRTRVIVFRRHFLHSRSCSTPLPPPFLCIPAGVPCLDTVRCFQQEAAAEERARHGSGPHGAAEGEREDGVPVAVVSDVLPFLEIITGGVAQVNIADLEDAQSHDATFGACVLIELFSARVE